MPPSASSSSAEVLGYWGEPTATIDWCEDNYEVSNFFYRRRRHWSRSELFFFFFFVFFFFLAPQS